VTAQHLPRMAELVACKTQHLLHRLEQFSATGMKQESVEVAKRKSVAIEKIIKRRCQRFFHQRRQFRAEHDAEAVVLYVPSHDVLGIAPTPLAACKNARPCPRAISGIVQQQARSAVAE